MSYLPIQRLPLTRKGEQWRKDVMDYFDSLSYSTTTSIRNTNYNKKINYDLFNGIFDKKDLEYVCNPLGLPDNEFPASLQHYDIVSPPLNLLISEEAEAKDNCIVYSESTNDINRKQQALKDQIMQSLEATLMGEIDPSTIDPNNPPPTPEQLIKYSKHNVSDLLESKANKLLKHLKKYLNTKEVFKKGWKDALITGEEIYWSGVGNNEVIFRRCNPINITVVLDSDTDYIDDAIAVVEVRMLAPSTIMDEFGKDIKPSDLKKLEELSKRFLASGKMYGNNPAFVLDKTTGGVTDTGISGIGGVNATAGGINSGLLRVVRVEWMSLKKLYSLKYVDENDLPQEMLVDESFDLDVFKEIFPTATADELWINEAWEGIKIDADMYVSVQPKTNQRRRMDNPYPCRLGYTGLIYNATNSISTSLVDRIKPYQYLYNIIAYRLELAFARDQGKVMLMDLAQLPKSEGLDLDRWMYYLKAMGIGFINSFEEGNKGSNIGKLSTFNQFQSIDLSMANTIQQYITTLDYIKQQTAFISGVSPQRLGAIENRELVGNVERAVQQSAVITRYLFDSHEEVKRRSYVALVECAKIAYKDGKKVQFVLDDMGLELLDMEEFEFENSDFNVFMTNSGKDLMVVETLKQLAMAAMNNDKADLSTIIDTIINDNPKDIVRLLQRDEEARKQHEQEMQQQQLQSQQQIQEMTMADKEADRALKQYEIDTNNETKLQVAEINALGFAENADVNENAVPDVMEVAKLSLEERDIASKAFLEQSKLAHDKDKHDKELAIKDKELKMKSDIENKKIEAIRVQNSSQEKMQQKDHELKKEEMKNKLEVEKLKIAAAKAKARVTPKKPKK